jgi:predicted aspartyl protease
MRYVAAVLLMLFWTAKAVANPSWVPVAIDSAGAIIVHVRINDRGPFPFLLDTGASHSVVSESLTERLKLRLVAETTVTTSTGREIRGVVRLNETSIGSARSETVLASVAPASRLAAIARGIDGIIGQDFLFSFNYTLDYRRHRLIWTDGASTAEGTRLPLIAQHGRYLVQIAVPGERTPMMLVPDSGANGFVMFARHGRTRMSLHAFAPPDGNRFGEAGWSAQTTSVHSVSGRQTVRTMMMRELRIGDVTVRDQPVAVIARDGGDEREGDGLLPLHLFASVSFNAREQCLIIRRD